MLWQQNAGQDARAGGGNWSWQDARRRYLDALTRPRKEDVGDERGRDYAFAELFETLGHLTHLVQDASVPAHVRNDQHLVHDGYERHIDRLRRAAVGSPRRQRFESFLNAPAVLPPFSIFTPTTHPNAPVPIARLIDRDLFGGVNSDVLSAPDIGIAEYTNGNFLSDDTLFTPFLLPRRPVAGTDFFEPEGTRLRRYFSKTTEGATIPHFVAESTLYEPARAELGAPLGEAVTLTRRVYEDYASLLLPRAVGYSAALLDYFFRGRLDVDVVEAVTGDPSTVRLTGLNASADALGGGTLKLYPEDPATGERTAATLLEGSLSVVAAPNAPINSATFQIPLATERFIAIYEGALGQEIPSGDFKGAVIGKVIGGHRVEEVFLQGGRWNLRTPTGTFPLPIFSNVVDLRWGDVDNTLVGRTAFGTGQPNTMFSWKIDRPVGSVDVPRTGTGEVILAGAPVTVAFPFGIDLGVDLTLNGTINYRQYLLSYLHRKVVSGGAGAVQFEDFGPGQSNVEVSASASATFSWPLTLTANRFNTFGGVPFMWRLEQIGLRGDGHIVALVSVRLTVAGVGVGAFFPSKRFVWCSTVAFTNCPTPPAVEDGPPAGVAYRFGPRLIMLWALVDVSAGAVLYTTAPEPATAGSRGQLVVNHTQQETRYGPASTGGVFNGLQVTEIYELTSDGNLSYPIDTRQNVRDGFVCSSTGNAFPTVAEVDVRTGSVAASASQFRQDLAGLSPGTFSENLVSTGNACFNSFWAFLTPVKMAATWQEARAYLPTLQTAVRTADGSDRVGLLLTATPGAAVGGADFAHLVRWEPLGRTAELRYASPAVELWVLSSVARELALLHTASRLRLFMVPLAGGDAVQELTLSNSSTVRNFVVLSPQFLYNTADLRFYRFRPSLSPTALPLPLAAGIAQGDYHTVKLK